MSSSDDENPLSDRLQSNPDPRSISPEMRTELFALPNLPPLPNNPSKDLNDEFNRNSRQMCADDPWSSPDCDFTVTSDNNTLDNIFQFGGHLSRESWVVPMLAVATVNVIVLIAFEIYVVCKASRNTPSRRHLFLGQMLLLGLLLGSLVGFAYAVEPNEFSCGVIRFGTGFSYALIYSSLLVKLVFLISLNTGVYLPATYQALLFFFCILVQFAVGIQWLSYSGNKMCYFATRDHLLSLLYVVFLILFATSLAVKSRHYRDNYREAKYIGALMAVTIPIWLAWIMASVVLNETYHPACLGIV